jgi:hypothetical protein
MGGGHDSVCGFQADAEMALETGNGECFHVVPQLARMTSAVMESAAWRCGPIIAIPWRGLDLPSGEASGRLTEGNFADLSPHYGTFDLQLKPRLVAGMP